MIGIVVSGHINFATGVESAVKAIAGEQEQMEFVDFVESMSTDELEQALRAAAKRVDSGEGVLFLTDIPGGSPANRALTILMDTENVELIGGANLPMIANAAFERDDTTVKELVTTLLEIGSSCMQDMRLQLELFMEPEPECEDGL
ncbi:PTS galactosamine/N-acetylgalactosamine transporter subunit IIA [Aliivibrio fischeri]|uniref:PTS N-acetylgalactosamine IIA component n=3 Tax=Aliivibrio fischeri TaxID=668 RepID=A0A1E5AKZ1_ALIFS|nr:MULTISPECIES: PTS galactosamine/N-acetylgalactosamine transporter subunit IIA [Aliivibrio]ACH63931.1 PTS system, N-acetylgalactosamine-specific IIA component [Aliivibrio fischeri MJ11]EHN68365.1 PTS system, N-acetylgalactosamine-specific IIA component [Aliivibrio fischeri SR5]MBD1571038.1 PTS sugar transporter subunit IIA [Aliivibrio sp. S10_S31]MBP3139771.1 PTS sugar transporter subunit IIA [Aliivibrio fischeri]MBP3154156.1 PTS sugar transporter subunit IIA [Aliivibrio fischeri]